jgi:uncharacterized protein with von Willebrand factor type A (vWA) domain
MGPEDLAPSPPVDRIVHFARLLRAAGMPVGSDRVLAAVQALEAVGLARRDDAHAALSAVMLDRREQQWVFDQAFDAFWRAPEALGSLVQAASREDALQRAASPLPALPLRLAEALASARGSGVAAAEDPARPPAAAARREASDRERLQRADFEAMSAEEFRQARALAEQLPLPVEPVRRRRRQPAPRGRIDLRRTLRGMARQPQSLAPAFARQPAETPPLVVLLDISGSMERYARVVLHYVHGLACRRVKVFAFTFGTQLTDITRCLRDRDPDVALHRADAAVPDWKGGTRIAGCLEVFNRRWARRVLGGRATVLLVTDGLDRGDRGRLGDAAAQLHRLAHRVAWLNPLLRYERFQPRAAGVRALLPHVDRFLPVHNLASLADLGRALRAPAVRPSSLLN